MPDSILEATRHLRQDFFEKQSDLLESLARDGQSPKALFVGCSDSRVVPELLLGANPGDLFVLRNVANIIPPYFQTEVSVVSVLEFAVKYLKVAHLIVCGHTDCGGILMLDSQFDITQDPALSRWLDLARPARRSVDRQLSNLSGADRHVAVVGSNVLLQLDNVASYPFVRQALEANQLELHGWIYHLAERRISYYDADSREFVFSEDAGSRPD